MSPADLPPVNAGLNALSAIFLAAGYIQIRRKNKTAHRNCMIAAFGSSVLFLACYLTYHTYLAYYLHQGPTAFREPAGFRPVYLAILGSHTLLAMAVVPMSLVTLSRALRQKFDRHRRIARWTLPVWMYVSVTGVAIYLLLYQVFPQHTAVATP